MSGVQGKRIVLGVTGSVAAYKAAELVRLIVRGGGEVDVVLTDAGMQFVGPATFQALTGRPVWGTLWDARMANGMAHIDLGRAADAVLVAPATADFMAKLAHGFADDLLSTLCLARDCPLLLAPAMNRQMWEKPATGRNLAQLVADGANVLGPCVGEQACGENGVGRMIEAADLYEDLVAFLQPKVLSGRRFLLTAGPTFEALDPVRGLTNASSGKMGFALARACVEAGAEVTLVVGPVALASPRGARRIDVTSALQMREQVLRELPRHEVFISVAAVADYRPEQSAEHKIKKGTDLLRLDLVANPDILAEVAVRQDAPFCVGFAAETRNLAEYAEGKRQAKRLPLVVGNLVRDGLGGDRNAVTLFDSEGAHEVPPGEKLEVARGIVAHIAKMLGKRDAADRPEDS